MNNTARANFSKLRISIYFLPAFLIVSIVVFLFYCNALNRENVVNIQKSHFLFLNNQLSHYPETLHNCTHFGDAMIFLSLLALLIVYAPKVWESLLSASIISAVFTIVLKKLFKIPRPAAMYVHDQFTIIGDKLTGHNSFPSGHSITVFTVLSVLLFAFMPKKMEYKVLWCSSLILLGLFLVMTRVGVGAHYPLDVAVGAIVGYISGVSGILLNEKYKLWDWISNKKFYPIFIITFLVCIIVLILKILNANLIIFYLALINLLISIFIITKLYVKKSH